MKPVYTRGNSSEVTPL